PTGSPHRSVFLDRRDTDAAKRGGPLIARHPAFPPRTNVQFVRVTDKRTLDIRIWERGAGYTLASGSSSCAAAAASVRNGRCEHGRPTARMPGRRLVTGARP